MAEQPLTERVYEAVITLDCQIPSVNSAFGAGKRKDGSIFRYRDPVITRFQKKFTEQLEKTNFVEVATLRVVKSSLHLDFYLTTEFWSRDTSNMFKFTEDAVHRVIKSPDSRNCEISARKYESEIEQEVVRVIYTCFTR